MVNVNDLAKMSKEDLAAMVLKLSQAPQARITVKHSTDKGTVSVYGLNARFPVSLYPSQWERLLTDAVMAEIRKACKVAAPIADARREAKAA